MVLRAFILIFAFLSLEACVSPPPPPHCADRGEGLRPVNPMMRSHDYIDMEYY